MKSIKFVKIFYSSCTSLFALFTLHTMQLNNSMPAEDVEQILKTENNIVGAKILTLHRFSDWFDDWCFSNFSTFLFFLLVKTLSQLLCVCDTFLSCYFPCFSNRMLCHLIQSTSSTPSSHLLYLSFAFKNLLHKFTKKIFMNGNSWLKKMKIIII